MTDKYKKHIQRFKDLIKEFEEEIFPKRISDPKYLGGVSYSYPEDLTNKLQAWLMKCENIIGIVFGQESSQVKRFLNSRDSAEFDLYQKLYQIKGLLEADLDDLENGFLLGQEFIIANEVFDSVLEEAKFFIYDQKNKDIGAILLRIVLEDSIKRIAKKEGIEINGKKTSILNDELKSQSYFIQTTWRQNQAWLDIGNKAAHGNFDNYDLNQVENFYQGLVNFLSSNFN